MTVNPSRFLVRKAWLCILLALALPALVFTQSKLLDRANGLYKMEQYAQAAVLYEEALAELEAKGKSERNLLNARTKLAYCYRMNNRLAKAEALYAQVVQSDRAKPETYLFYGETLMANEKYDEAKQWFLDYQIMEPKDERGRLMAEACEQVKRLEPHFQHVEIQAFAHNSEADDNAPASWQGGIVFSSDRKSGLRLMKEKSGWTGREYLDLYFSEKRQDGTFAEPKQFSSKLSEVNKNTGNASFAFDGSEVFFTRNDNVLNKQNTYNLQLFRAAANGDSRWREVEKLPFCSPNYNFMHPSISPDGQMLFFVSDKPGGQGGTDLWVSQRKADGWASPENLGPAVNSPANEGFPFMDAHGRLYFCSKGHLGYGGFDIFFTEMTGTGTWKNPVNLGKPINSPLDDISIFVDADRRTGMFASSRNGGDDDIFCFQVGASTPQSTVVPAAPTARDAAPVGQVEMVPAEQVADTLPLLERPAEPLKFRIAPPDEPAEIESLSHVVFPEIAVPEMVPAPPADLFEAHPLPEPVDSLAKLSGLPEGLAIDDFVRIDSPAVGSVNLSSFQDFLEKAASSSLQPEERYRIDGATYDPQIWQLTPNISKKLDELVGVMRRFPALHIELGAHTEALGVNDYNLRLSEQRAQMAVAYLVQEGIEPGRLEAKGYGETKPLNHCQDGVTCGMDEHLFNQRLEVKIQAVAVRQ